jgi:NADH:ubiquinone oxidoreductase subunit H
VSDSEHHKAIVGGSELSLTRPLRYQNHYAWFVFVSSLDIMLTWVILFFGGWEVNQLADFIIRRWGLPGMVTFKFAIVVFVICLCEIVGRRRHHTGRRLAEWSIAITCIPVTLALVQLAVHL